ncbi:MAG: DUF6261 family protein [Bacteroidetes bacterium]|nr:DUF6261 family protein [Bacteroidota bacterium]
MKINNIHLVSLRNAEHYQFQTEFKNLVEKSTALALGIDARFQNYLSKYTEESEALVYITKNSQTDALVNADSHRDQIFRGLCDTVKAACNHFVPAKAEAAKKLMIIFDTYGNLTSEAYNEETAKINSLYKELNENHAAEINLLAITDWVEELKAGNLKFENIKNERYNEESAKTTLRMKQVRIEIDKQYQEIINLINALILVNGESQYKDFVTEMNHRIVNSKEIIAKRKAKSAKDDAAFVTEKV